MRPGYQLVDRTEKTLDEDESQVIRKYIKDEYYRAVSDWMLLQKPKIKAPFIAFLKSLDTAEPDQCGCKTLSERIAKDVLQTKFHPKVHNSMNQQYSDIMNLLNGYLSRSNVMATIPSVPDQSPKLFKAIAQEDHMFSKPKAAHHKNPVHMQSRDLTINDTYKMTKPYNPGTSRSSPFAIFPDGEEMHTTMQDDFQQRKSALGRSTPFTVHNVLNTPTCL